MLTWTREREDELIDAIATAVAARRPARCAADADLYRVGAQLLATRHAEAAEYLAAEAQRFYEQAALATTSITQLAHEDRFPEPSRLRGLLEKRLEGVRSW